MGFLKKLFFIIFIILLILAASSPYLLSTKKGSKLLVNLISKKENISFSFDKLSFSWLGPQKVEGLKYSDNNLDIYIGNISSNISFIKLISLQRKKNILAINTFSHIKNGDVVIKYPNFSKAHLTNIFGDVKILENEKINLKITGITTILNKKGSFDISMDYSKKDASGNFNLQNFPSITLEEILFYKHPQYKNTLTKIVGSFLNLKTSFDLKDLEGPINLKIESPNILSSISAKYSKNAITLEKPISASLKLTEELSKLFIKDVNPLFVTAVSSKKPISIKISNEDFYLPIPFNLKKLNISNASIDLHKIHAKNSGNLSLIISLMKKHLMGVDEMDIWCTPLDIQIKNGILNASRMDMLVDDSIHVCTFGYIDLIQDKVKMTLGLTSQALRYSFGIKNLPEEYVLKVPMRGSTSNVKIDAKKAAAKIAALKAMQSKDNIFSDILGAIKNVQDDQSKIPAAKRPFPWE